MESYLVRVWRPGTAGSEPDGGLRGTVVHLPSRRTTTFQDQQTLLEILRGSPGEPGSPHRTGATGRTD